MKILKELRKVIDRNADCYKKVIRNYKEEPRKIRKFICQDKIELKVMNSKMNNVEKRIVIWKTE